MAKKKKKVGRNNNVTQWWQVVKLCQEWQRGQKEAVQVQELKRHGVIQPVSQISPAER